MCDLERTKVSRLERHRVLQARDVHELRITLHCAENPLDAPAPNTPLTCGPVAGTWGYPTVTPPCLAGPSTGRSSYTDRPSRTRSWYRTSAHLGAHLLGTQ